MSQPEPEPGQPQPGPQPGPSWPPPPPPPPTVYQPYPQYPQYPPPPPQPVYAVPAPMPQPRTSSTGPASFACGLMAALLGWIPFVGVVGIGLGVLGLTLGMKALRLAKFGYLSDRGLAITGVVLSCLGMAFGVVFTGIVLVALSAG